MFSEPTLTFIAMAGEPELTGLAKTFNSQTFTANSVSYYPFAVSSILPSSGPNSAAETTEVTVSLTGLTADELWEDGGVNALGNVWCHFGSHPAMLASSTTSRTCSCA